METETTKQKSLPTFDYNELDRQLDKVKSRVFMAPGAAFYGSLVSSLRFVWNTGIETACTDGANVWWNPQFFIEAPTKYNEPRFNDFVLRHELGHSARLHMLRMGDRNPTLWNYACDVRINNDQKKLGYSWGTFPAWYRPEFDQDGEAVEEDIYKILFAQGFEPPANPWGNSEFVDPEDPNTWQKCINNVVRAKTQAELEQKVDDIPGGTQAWIDHFLAPIVPWEQILHKWFTDLRNSRHSWKRPRRRTMSQNIYLPSRCANDGNLTHLMYMLDVSGSITEADIVRFNSELKHVWDTFKPKKMTVVQFDSIIQKVDEYKVGDAFARIEVIGRGGNNMEPVRQFINEHQPTAAILFTDLGFEPMAPLDHDIPVLWITTSPDIEPPYGDVLRIPQERLERTYR